MGRPYSLDLRQRVVDAAASTSRRQAAARFGVGIATAIRWAAALVATGTVAARSQGRPRTSKLDPHEAFLRGLIDGQDDITLEEMRALLCGLAVGRQPPGRVTDTRVPAERPKASGGGEGAAYSGESALPFLKRCLAFHGNNLILSIRKSVILFWFHNVYYANAGVGAGL